MRREHDDVPGNTRHDDTGQCHGRRGNAGRIAAGLLERFRAKWTPVRVKKTRQNKD
jgi:hypothetical protein